MWIYLLILLGEFHGNMGQLFLPTEPKIIYIVQVKAFKITFEYPSAELLTKDNFDDILIGLVDSLKTLLDVLSTYPKILYQRQILDLTTNINTIRTLSYTTFPSEKTIDTNILEIKSCKVPTIYNLFANFSTNSANFIKLITDSQTSPTRSLDIQLTLSLLSTEVNLILNYFTKVVTFAKRLNINRLYYADFAQLIGAYCPDILDQTNEIFTSISQGVCYLTGKQDLECTGNLHYALSPQNYYITTPVNHHDLIINISNIMEQEGKFSKFTCEMSNHYLYYNCTTDKTADLCLTAINKDDISEINSHCPIIHSEPSPSPILLKNGTLITTQAQVQNLPSRFKLLNLPSAPFILHHKKDIDLGKIFKGHTVLNDTFSLLKPYALIPTDTVLPTLNNVFTDYLEIFIIIAIFLGYFFTYITYRLYRQNRPPQRLTWTSNFFK